MLSEEEKEAIEILENEKSNLYVLTQTKFTTCTLEQAKAKRKAINTVLNLITKLRQENEELTTALSKQSKDIGNYLVELQQKDKQINMLTSKLSDVCTGIDVIREQFKKEYCEFINSDEDCCWKTDKNCQDCIKQYFERKTTNIG